MKYTITVLMVIIFVFSGCKKNTTDSNNDENVQSYSTLNVKENTVYYKFSTNQGSTNANSDYDMVFYAEMFVPGPGAPEVADPRFKVKQGLSIAVVETENLSDVSEVPAASEFIENFISEWGEWYVSTDAHVVVPLDHVYIVNTTDGKFPAFEITNYYGDQGESGVFTIEWKYLSE